MIVRDFFNKYKKILKMCPYCGSVNVDTRQNDGFVNVYCQNCGLLGPKKRNDSSAINSWNKRSELPKCYFCGGDIINNECSKCHSIIPSGIVDDDNEHVSCYIDILGFSNYTTNYSLNDSVRLIERYSSVFKYRNLNEKYESFLYFHPVSDGIFIIGRDPDEFVKDVCKFCCASYLINANEYFCPHDENDVAKVSVSVIGSAGEDIKQEYQYWFPVIFSGGISCGEVAIFTQPSLYGKKEIDVPNYVGKTITKSANLERKYRLKGVAHGARIYLDEDFVSKLSDKVKGKYVYTHQVRGENLSELLWPSALFLDSNKIDFNIINGVSELFTTLLKYYKQYINDARLEAVYFNTLKLIICSQKQFIKYMYAFCADILDCYEPTEKDALRKTRENFHAYLVGGLESIEDELFDNDIWHTGDKK